MESYYSKVDFGFNLNASISKSNIGETPECSSAVFYLSSIFQTSEIKVWSAGKFDASSSEYTLVARISLASRPPVSNLPGFFIIFFGFFSLILEIGNP